MAGSVHVPWYATGFRGDGLQDALETIAPVAARYGATGWVVYRSTEDRYKFLHVTDFENKVDFERWWYGPEMIQFRAVHSSWYQVPVLYSWHDKFVHGAINGVENGHEAVAVAAPPADGDVA